MERIDWIDYAKTVGIFLVILSHTDIYYPVVVVIYTFHMPLFFVLSGYNFSFQRNPLFVNFVKKKFNQLIIAYLSINFITYITWFLIGRKYGDDLHREVEWFVPIVNTILGYPSHMVHNIPVWFFLCLFVVEILFYVLFRRKNNYVWLTIGILILICVAWANSSFNPYVLPFTIPAALCGVVFYAFGYLLKQTKLIVSYNFIFAIVELLIVLLVAWTNGKIAMHKFLFGNFLLFFIGGIAGTLFIINLSQYLAYRFRTKKLINYLGSNTLVICGFHLQTFSVIKAFVVYVLGMSISIFTQKIGLNILFSLISMALCFPIIWFVNKYLPFVAGRSNQKK